MPLAVLVEFDLARGRDAIARLAWLALRNGRDHPRLLTLLTDAIRQLEADLRGLPRCRRWCSSTAMFATSAMSPWRR